MWILNTLRSLITKLINKVFGKTQVFIIILGWFLLATGLIMLWRPEWARRKLSGMGFGILKGYLLLLMIFLALTFLLDCYWV
jgi:hypothetical protein